MDIKEGTQCLMGAQIIWVVADFQNTQKKYVYDECRKYGRKPEVRDILTETH